MYTTIRLQNNTGGARALQSVMGSLVETTTSRRFNSSMTKGQTKVCDDKLELRNTSLASTMVREEQAVQRRMGPRELLDTFQRTC